MIFQIRTIIYGETKWGRYNLPMYTSGYRLKLDTPKIENDQDLPGPSCLTHIALSPRLHDREATPGQMLAS